MNQPEHFLPYKTVALEDNDHLREDIVATLWAQLPAWVNFAVDTASIEDQAVIRLKKLHYLDEVSPVDRDEIDFYFVTLAATHTNRILLRKLLPLEPAPNDNPLEYLDTCGNPKTDIFDNLKATSDHWLRSLHIMTSKAAKDHRANTKAQEALIVTATRLLLLGIHEDDIDKSIRAYLSDRTKGPRATVYELARRDEEKVRALTQDPLLTNRTFAKLTKARLLLKYKRAQIDKNKLIADVADAVRLEEKKGKLAALERALFYPWALRGKVRATLKPGEKWNSQTDIFGYELSDLLELLRREETEGNKPFLELDTEPGIEDQYYQLFSRNPSLLGDR